METLLPHEYPRPDYRRAPFQLLNGSYQFAFDDDEVGLSEAWYGNKQLEQSIQVPYCYQSPASTVGDTSYHPVVWYKRLFTVDAALRGGKLLLHFGAVDYQATVWVNGKLAGTHTGGYTPFSFEISAYLVSGKEQDLTVRVEDRFDPAQVRGKQYWKTYNEMCWYQASTGIWQSVWLEKVGESWIKALRCTPDIDTHTAAIAYQIEGRSDQPYKLKLVLSYENLARDPSSYSMDPSYKPSAAPRVASEVTVAVLGNEGSVTVPVPPIDNIKNTHFWTAETPNLIGVHAILSSAEVLLDTVDTYFGMRKIEIQGNEILLNHQNLRQILVLDQGYWEESYLTPPSSEALKRDIELAKRFGFNGARKHQKIEDPHFYYWADVLGFLVWGELPSTYQFSERSQEAMLRDLRQFILRDYNHPCIITWVPLNESWGVRDIVSSAAQQHFARTLYFLVRSMDSTRLVVTNDGWEQVNETDFYGIHDYTPVQAMLNPAYFVSQEAILGTSAQKKRCMVDHLKPQDKPLLVTEYGGIAFDDGSSSSWGYFGKVGDEEAFLARFKDITQAFLGLGYVRGICYTQLTDVFQEKNGLLDMKRVPKVAPEQIAAIIRGGKAQDIKPNLVL